MSQPFDHSRFAWYPASLGGPGAVHNSSNQPRPPLQIPLRFFTVHYAGAGTNWLDFGDTAAELRGVELNHARPSGKPNEYNSASDSAGETWEYAGRFLAAHSGSPFNSTDWGHLALYGLEVLSESDAVGLIRGIRRARAQCVRAGYLTANHTVVAHGERRSTPCPGPLWSNRHWWGRITAPLTPVDFDQVAPLLPEPTPPSPPITLEDPDMAPTCFVTDTRVRGVFALVGGRWVPWLFPVPKGALHFTGDHVLTREQILADQGSVAAGLWRQRGGL
jgi:hypothetical protein